MPSDTIGDALRFKARELDPTGLYYMRARYYDPTLARFISQDPLGDSGGENAYGFGVNDPVNSSDPSGSSPCSRAIEEEGGYVTSDDGKWCIYVGQPLPPIIVSSASTDFASFWQTMVNGIAGFGDLASAGTTWDIRQQIGGNENVDVDSRAYDVGAAISFATLRTLQSMALSRALFSTGFGLVNSNRYLRIGLGRHDGYAVFRISGQLVRAMPTWLQDLMGENNGHLLNVPIRPWPWP
jgi:RHS repeat-associated protein